MRTIIPPMPTSQDPSSKAWIKYFNSIRMNTEASQVGVDVNDGTKDVALETNKNAKIQLWDTPLSFNRYITFSNKNAYNGSWFKIIRTVNATKYDMTVNSEKVLNAGQWCEVVYTGTQWRVIASGNL